MSKKKLILFFPIAAMLIALTLIYTNFFQKRISNIPSIKEGKQEIAEKTDIPRLGTVASNLEVPWALVFLPDESILFTERIGRVRFIDANGSLQQSPIATIEDVKQIGESGLHGIAIHPDFSNNHFVYLYYTYGASGNETLNRVVRFKLENNALSDRTIIVDKIPGALFHDGGRIKFGPASQRGKPDGFLYITTGDAQNPSLAQDKNSLAGKILRVDLDGKNLTVISYGHRNPQGITWDDKGNLWETEHGQSATDELNLIEIGKNYGWPARLASESVAGRPENGMVDPTINSGSDTWAPAGLAYVKELNSLFFGGLRGQALYEYNIENKILTPHLKGEIGRIREVVLGPDNLLYITTSNRDGRGAPDSTDDKILRINPAKL